MIHLSRLNSFVPLQCQESHVWLDPATLGLQHDNPAQRSDEDKHRYQDHLLDTVEKNRQGLPSLPPELMAAP